MGFQDDPTTISWKLHLRTPSADVYDLLATDAGRARFWADSAIELEGRIEFRFGGGFAWSGRVLERRRPEAFAVEYVGGGIARFELAPDGAGGTDLTLTETDVALASRPHHVPGWVLLALKAGADFAVDLRNHDPRRTWSRYYVDGQD